ncbi:MAG: rhomboid family intramembrane serine protease [Flavobacteriales bacterium]|nr:rhomboid family intramembrane serine protease [Crocinitomicaceae bacterium]NBX79843.1 rhomboid family intramembrane serine protease [Flavobacteriales bacterium]NCA22033.1 rhomboid family intramembrane serine protease [Crocinitomicaceae bacterium]
MINNLPQVTKNILILNIVMFVVTLILENQGIDLGGQLGAHYINSALFQPYQIITHFFMHADFFHILFNMYAFIILGAHLERIWGPQRFFIFYVACALGAFGLYNIIGVYQLAELKSQLSQEIPLSRLDIMLQNMSGRDQLLDIYNSFLSDNSINSSTSLIEYVNLTTTPMVGASGAIFGIMAAFAILFPNTEFLIYFTIPVKAKYLVAAYFAYELYASFQNSAGDNVAHLAHVGGAIVGAVLVLIWRKKDRTNFW